MQYWIIAQPEEPVLLALPATIATAASAAFLLASALAAASLAILFFSFVATIFKDADFFFVWFAPLSFAAVLFSQWFVLLFLHLVVVGVLVLTTSQVSPFLCQSGKSLDHVFPIGLKGRWASSWFHILSIFLPCPWGAQQLLEFLLHLQVPVPPVLEIWILGGTCLHHLQELSLGILKTFSVCSLLALSSELRASPPSTLLSASYASISICIAAVTSLAICTVCAVWTVCSI